MKKFKINSVIIVLLLLFSSFFTVFGETLLEEIKVTLTRNIRVEVNGQQLAIPKGNEILVRNGVSYLPVRVISESLGAKVGWNNATRTISLTTPNKSNVAKEKSILTFTGSLKQNKQCQHTFNVTKKGRYGFFMKDINSKYNAGAPANNNWSANVHIYNSAGKQIFHTTATNFYLNPTFYVDFDKLGNYIIKLEKIDPIEYQFNIYIPRKTTVISNNTFYGNKTNFAQQTDVYLFTPGQNGSYEIYTECNGYSVFNITVLDKDSYGYTMGATYNCPVSNKGTIYTKELKASQTYKIKICSGNNGNDYKGEYKFKIIKN